MVFAAFCVAGVEIARDLLVTVGVPEGGKMESERLRAAGSMSGMMSKVGKMGAASTLGTLSQLHLTCAVSKNDKIVL